MSMFTNDNNYALPYGIYEALLDEELYEALLRHPELRSVLSKIDPEEQPSRYAAFVAKVIEKSLQQETDPIERLNLCNHLIDLLSGTSEKAYLQKHKLVPGESSVLSEITPPHYAQQGIPRPATPIVESSLFTGSPHEPQLVQELQLEMRSADSVDILISFIKWSGLRLLMPAFEDLHARNVPVRVITTSYMGASDSPAVEWLAKMPNIEVRVSYDTDRTRLHAKAYHFQRNSGFSTAYIGSANMSHAAITSGLEWNLKVTAQDMPHILENFLQSSRHIGTAGSFFRSVLTTLNLFARQYYMHAQRRPYPLPFSISVLIPSRNVYLMPFRQNEPFTVKGEIS